MCNNYLSQSFFQELHCYGGDSPLEMFKSLPKVDQAIIFHNFLLATTAKDVSVMISFSIDFVSCENSLSNCNDSHFDFSFEKLKSHILATIKIIDLDPKPFTKLSHYVQLDNEIIDTFIHI